MAFDVTDFNLNPNQPWFIQISDIGSVALVEVFNTKADMDASTNRVAFNNSVIFGTDIEVELTEDTTEPLLAEAIGKFNSSLDYHMKVSGTNGDPTIKFEIGPFTDLEPIEDAMLLTEQMIQDRATLELNRATHTALRRSINLKSHFPDLDESDIITLSSTKRGLVSVRNRIDSLTISASIDSSRRVDFADRIEVVEFVDFVRTGT